jgi:hypothetical protein
MEWMPIRRGPGIMGVVNTTSITQVIEWGKLATVVLFDSRVSFRSKDPTIRDSTYSFVASLEQCLKHDLTLLLLTFRHRKVWIYL